jgi:hypothetical protein
LQPVSDKTASKTPAASIRNDPEWVWQPGWRAKVPRVTPVALSDVPDQYPEKHTQIPDALQKRKRIMSSDKNPKPTPKTLGESMEAMNWEEVGVTLRPYPTSAADLFLVSSRKGDEESPPPGLELFAEMMRDRARTQNDAFEQEDA